MGLAWLTVGMWSNTEVWGIQGAQEHDPVKDTKQNRNPKPLHTEFPSPHTFEMMVPSKGLTIFELI